MNRTDISYQDYMYDFMKEICNKIGPRIGWSENERKCAYMIRNELKKYCDEVEIEEFNYNRSFYLMFKIPLILNIVGILSYLLVLFGINVLTLYFNITSVACFSLALFFLLGQFIFNKDVMGIFAKSGESQNVIGKIKAKKSANRILIFSGHHDSTWHFTLMDKLGEKFLIFTYITIFFLFATFIVSIINLIWYILTNNYNLVLDIITRSLYIGSIPFIATFSLFMIDKSRETLGANDNLSGVVVMLGVAKYLAEKGRCNNIEVWCVSFGSEEGGLHGSKAFVKKHLNELDKAILINADTIGHGKIRIAKKELLISHDKRVIELIDTAANNLGIEHSIMGSGGGRTDAMSFTERGLLAATMIGLEDSKKMPPDYHTIRDIPENLDPTLLKQVLEIDLEIIHLLDSGKFKID